jgi:hypothetical protein
MALPPLFRLSISCVLGSRTIGNANPTGGYDEEFAALKLVGVFRKHGIEVFDFGLQRSAGKPKENNASMGELLVKDQLAEIPVSNDQNPRLLPGDCQNILIGKTRRILARDGRNVMAEMAKVRHKAKIGALIKEEFHSAASERAPFGGFGETSLPVTRAWA